jgi:hypothetical protein
VLLCLQNPVNGANEDLSAVALGLHIPTRSSSRCIVPEGWTTTTAIGEMNPKSKIRVEIEIDPIIEEEEAKK